MQVLIWKALIWILSHLWTIIWMMVFIPSATRSLMGKVTAILMKMKSTLLSIPQPAHAQRSNPFWRELSMNQARIWFERFSSSYIASPNLKSDGICAEVGFLDNSIFTPYKQKRFIEIKSPPSARSQEGRKLIITWKTFLILSPRYLPTSTACSQLSAEYKIFYGWYKARGVHLEFKKMQSGINWLLNQFHDTCRGEQNLTNVHGKFRVAGSDENNNPSAILFMWKNE